MLILGIVIGAAVAGLIGLYVLASALSDVQKRR